MYIGNREFLELLNIVFRLLTMFRICFFIVIMFLCYVYVEFETFVNSQFAKRLVPWFSLVWFIELLATYVQVHYTV